MKRRKPRNTVLPISFVENPFVSEAQRRACYAADDPNWDCHEWAHATGKKKLPERKDTKNVANKRIINSKKRLACNQGKIVRNVDLGKLDPTRTLTLRRYFFQELRKRFARLKGLLVKLVLTEDAFGLKEQPNSLLDHFTTNARIQIPVVRQRDNYGCGAAAFASVSKYWNKDIDTEKEAISALGTSSKDGTSPEALERVAKLEGLVAVSHYGMSFADLSNYLQQGVPVILSIQAWGTAEQKAKNQAGHYVVAISMTDDGVEVMDPSSGYRTIDYTTLAQDWHDVGISPTEQYRRLGIAIGPKVMVDNCQPGQLRGADGKCGPGIGISIPREEMPQIKTDDLPSFIAYAQTKGVSIHKESATVSDLSPTQSEFRQERVDSLPDTISPEPILTSSDQYILDGTHRWIKAWQRDKQGSIPTLRINLPLESALDLMRGFPKAVYAENANPNHDEKGRFASGDTDWRNTSIEENPIQQLDPQLHSEKLSNTPDYFTMKKMEYKTVDVPISSLKSTQSWIRPATIEHMKDNPSDELPKVDRWHGHNIITDGNHRVVLAKLKGQDTIKVSVRQFDDTPLVNTRWAFQSNPQQLRAFQSWLDQQIKSTLTDETGKAAWDNYIQAGYTKGAGRAFDDTKKSTQSLAIGDQRKLDFYSGTRDEFLRSSFAQPVAREKVELLAQRAFDEMENVTSDMSTKISRTLTDGLVEGKSPNEVADDLAEQVDISATKAKRIANTEIIRAHAEGQLTALENLGVEEVGVAVEWAVSGLNTFDKRGNPISPCARCKAMAGVVLKISEARNLIPLHPECKCCWLPANIGEDDEDQKSSKEDIEAATQDANVDLEVDDDRPESIIGNVFIIHANPNHDAQGKFASSLSATFHETGKEYSDPEYYKEASAKIQEATHKVLAKVPKEFLEQAGVLKDGKLNVTIATAADPELQKRGLTGIEGGFADDENVTMLITGTRGKSTDDLAGTLVHEIAHKWEKTHGISDSEEYMWANISDVSKLSKESKDDWHYVGEGGSSEPMVEAIAQHLYPSKYSFGRHKPSDLERDFPKSVKIAKDKLKEKGIVSNTFNPDQPRDAHGQFAHLNDSSLKRMAKKAGIKHDGSREDMEKKLHEYMNPGASTKDTGSGASSQPKTSVTSTTALPAKTVEKVSTTTFDKAQAAHALTQSTARLGQDSYNLVHLADLRSAHPELSKDQFDQALRHAQTQSKLSLTPAEGRHGVDERDKNSAIYDKDEFGDKMLLYASVRNILSPYVDNLFSNEVILHNVFTSETSLHIENVFCPKGKGGGVDPTCKKPEGSRVSVPYERDTKISPIVKPFKAPPPKVKRRGGSKTKEGGIKRGKGEKSQTKLGDKTEEAATKIGFRNILPEGKRTFTAKEVEEYGSSIDTEYDHSGKLYELKMCKTTSSEYRLKAKLKEKQAKERFAKNVKGTVHTLIGVYDEDKGECHFYSAKNPGMTGAEVSEKNFYYHGKVKM